MLFWLEGIHPDTLGPSKPNHNFNCVISQKHEIRKTCPQRQRGNILAQHYRSTWLTLLYIRTQFEHFADFLVTLVQKYQINFNSLNFASF